MFAFDHTPDLAVLLLLFRRGMQIEGMLVSCVNFYQIRKLTEYTAFVRWLNIDLGSGVGGTGLGENLGWKWLQVSKPS